VLLVGHRTIEGQFKERGSSSLETRESAKLWSKAFSEKKLSNQEEKLQGIKEWENRKGEGSFRKPELVSKNPHCCKTIIFY
jgi:hypothetical protein